MNLKHQITLIYLCSLLVWSCKDSSVYTPPKDALFELQKNETLGIDFINQVEDSDSINVFNYRNFFNGAGVALLDVNRDGLLDIFFCANQKKSMLYLNKGNWAFENITDQSGIIHRENTWITGVSTADVNGDGWTDIYICHSGKVYGSASQNELYINQKNGTFKEQAQQYGLDDIGLTTHATFFDYDRDGDLDCYVLNNSLQSVAKFDMTPQERTIIDQRGGDRLYRNDHLHFVNVTESAGIYSSEYGFGLGVSVSDFNGDGYLDLYVSNDFFERDYLYINQKNGTFRDEILEQMNHISMASMGSDAADINNDGYTDIFTTEMLPEDNFREKASIKFEDYDIARMKAKNGLHHQLIQNTLQLNNGNQTFSEISAYAGTIATDWSWAALIFDFDNDGWKDIYVSNGIYKDLNNQDFIKFFASDRAMSHVVQKGKFDYKDFQEKLQEAKLVNYAFLNQKKLRFVNQSPALGLGYPSFSNGSSYGDLDNDGDLDLVVNNLNQEPFMFKNKTRELSPDRSHFITIKLQNDSIPNHSALGSKVSVYCGADRYFFELNQARGFQSSVGNDILVGVGSHSRIDSVVVQWIDGGMSILRSLAVDSVYLWEKHRVGYTDKAPTPHRPENQWLTKDEHLSSPTMVFPEDEYVDFDVERLMPQMLSRETPKMQVADLNQDGRQDLIVVTPSGNGTRLFMQDASGRLVAKKVPAFSENKTMEGAAVAVSDFNGDGRLDIAIAYGGNRYNMYHLLPKPILYLQSAGGDFVATHSFDDAVSINASTITALDIDEDKDMDLLITGRSVPGEYGSSPSLYILRNEGQGKWQDATQELGKDIQHLGMITQTTMADMDGDGKDEIIFAGDWFPITICKVQAGKINIEQQLPFSGFINQLLAKDLNGDHHIDLIVGNYGLNSKLNASDEKPLELWVNDFDYNGHKECFISCYRSDGKRYPIHSHDDLLMQLPSFKKRFLFYADYARATTDSVIYPDMQKQSLHRQITQLASGVLWNDGKGKFRFEAFPALAQLAPVRAIQITDLRQDGTTDILLHGNLYEIKPELGRYDALVGVVLSYAKGTIAINEGATKDFFLKGEVSDMQNIRLGGKDVYVVAEKTKGLTFFKAVK